MKTNKLFMASLVAVGLFTACSSYEDYHDYDYNKYAKWVSAPGIEAKDIPTCFSWNQVGYDYVMCINWENYQYKPHTEYGIAYTDSAILLHFKAKENEVRAFRATHMDSVWTDACVAFFFEPNKDGNYYAMFVNCTGHIYMDFGQDKKSARDTSTVANVEQIKCWASMGSQALPKVVKGETEWQVALSIPYKVFWRHDIKSISGLRARANLYKCCTAGDYEHYVTWRPVSTPQPDFYQTQYFKEIIFSEK